MNSRTLARRQREQHKTMNLIDKARAFGRYVDDYGYGGVSELARKIAKSQEEQVRRRKLCDAA